MILKVFSVYDSKALAFSAPFFAPTPGAAIRLFSDACNDGQTMWSKHPGDFVLYQIGEFDDGNAELSSLSPATHLGVGTDYVERKPKVNMPLVAPVEVGNGSKES